MCISFINDKVVNNFMIVGVWVFVEIFGDDFGEFFDRIFFDGDEEFFFGVLLFFEI